MPLSRSGEIFLRGASSPRLPLNPPSRCKRTSTPGGSGRRTCPSPPWRRSYNPQERPALVTLLAFSLPDSGGASRVRCQESSTGPLGAAGAPARCRRCRAPGVYPRCHRGMTASPFFLPDVLVVKWMCCSDRSTIPASGRTYPCY